MKTITNLTSTMLIAGAGLIILSITPSCKKGDQGPRGASGYEGKAGKSLDPRSLAQLEYILAERALHEAKDLKIDLKPDEKEASILEAQAQVAHVNYVTKEEKDKRIAAAKDLIVELTQEEKDKKIAEAKALTTKAEKAQRLAQAQILADTDPEKAAKLAQAQELVEVENNEEKERKIAQAEALKINLSQEEKNKMIADAQALVIGITPDEKNLKIIKAAELETGLTQAQKDIRIKQAQKRFDEAKAALNRLSKPN